MKFNILHFSDLHYDTKNHAKLELIRDKMIENIQKDSHEIDIVVFSGDLVQKPSSTIFMEAYKKFILPILNSLKIDEDKFFLTPGNHDINLDERDKVTFSGLKDFVVTRKDKKIIEELLQNKRETVELSNYKDFLDDLKQSTLNNKNSLYTISKTQISKDISFGLVSLNSSIFMEGKSKVDFGELWFIPESLLEATREIKDCTIKAINIHHSFSWFKNSKELEKLLLEKFNLVFFGHEHEHDGKRILDFYNRDILSLHASSIFHELNPDNGYCVYSYDLSEESLTVNKSKYNSHDKSFESFQEQIIENINLTSKAPNAIRNLSICSQMYPTVKTKINSYLAINLTSENNQKDIDEIFVFQNIVEHKKQEKEKKSFTLDEIIGLPEHILLSGKSESGKSTNLNMITLRCLVEFTNYIPIYISSAELMHMVSDRHFIAIIGEYIDKNYGKNKFNIKTMISEKRFIFLIDDIHLLESNLVKSILQLNNKIIATMTIDIHNELENKIEEFNKDSDEFKDFTKLDLTGFRKKDRISLTGNIVSTESSARIANSVHKTILNLRLPSTPFITTLLIWMHTEKIDIRENKPEIIDVFLDYLLEKTDLSKTFRGKFNFLDKKELLANIAYEFYRQQSFAIKEDTILQCIIEYIGKFGFDINSADILQYFYHRKIFLMNNGYIMFSYRVFYYYFISLYMISHREFTKEIMQSKEKIINMLDELKFYAAMKTDDNDFIEKLLGFLKDGVFPQRLEKYQLNTIKIVSTPLTLENVIELQGSKSKEVVTTLSAEDKKIGDMIDEKRTEALENNTQTYNYEVKENEVKYNKSFYKEEFLALNIILSEFIKNLSTVDIEYKQHYISIALENYANYFKFWEKILEKKPLLKKFIRMHFTSDLNNIKDEEFDALNIFLKAHVFSTMVEIVDDTLATPKMTKVYQNNIATEEDLHKFFFYTIIEASVDENHLIEMLNRLIDYNMNKNIFNVLYSKMLFNLIDKDYSGPTKDKIKDILIKLDIINGVGKEKLTSKRDYLKHMPTAKKRLDENIKIARLIF